MMDYKYKISVVVPIYNVEKYLVETLDSVISQSIGFEENIELILVNDGSPDNCDSICREYLSKYPDNIIYLIKENGGLSSARNYGIDYIRGKYVNFLDADDKWERTAFEKAYYFFENHSDEIDLLASRVRFFDYKDTWHVLDYKYNNGTRVIDVTQEENCVQVHVTSVFMKTEAIKHMRFNEKVRFGEDGLFSNTLILNKLKYGVVDDCIYYYRKRSDKSSLTQIQTADKDYYTNSPKLYYEGLINESVSAFGCVIPYIQNVLAYDIGWRVRSAVPDEIKSDRLLFGAYLEFLNKVLSYVDDSVFLRSKVHKRLSVKCAFYKLKHPEKELVDISHFDIKKKSVYAGDVRLYNFNKDNHSACIITDCTLKNGTLKVEGLISKWLLSIRSDNETFFSFKIDDKILKVELTDCTNEKNITIFGEEFPYYSFSETIDLSNVFDELRLSAVLAVDKSYMKITLRYKSEEDIFSLDENYVLNFSSDGLTVYLYKHNTY